MLQVRRLGAGVGVGEGELLYLEGADQAVARFGVGVVVQGAEGCEACGEFLVAVGLQGAAVVGVDGSVGQTVASHDGVDVEACAAAEDGLPVAALDVGQGGVEVAQEAVGAVLLTGVADVDEVVGNGGAVEGVVGEVLAGAYVHAAEHLARVGADDFGFQTIGHLGRQGGLAGGRGAEDGDEGVTHRGR